MTTAARTRLAAAIVTITGLAALVSIHDPFFAGLRADEFLIASWGKQVAAGGAPYRDFFTFLGPLIPYGAGGLAAVFGPGTVPLRVVSVLAQLGAMLALFGLARARGGTPLFAAALALWLPVLLVPFWPYVSHQWVAGACAVIAVALAVVRDSTLALLLAGVLGASAALMVQTIGVLVLPALVVIGWLGEPRRGRLGWLAAGAALPVGASVALLARDSALRDAVHLVLVWPLRFYKQGGGFNAGSFFDYLGGTLTTPLSRTIPQSELIVLGCVALLVLLAVVGAVRWAVDARTSAQRGGVALWPGLTLASTGAVYLLGRNDLPHLAFLAPATLLVVAAMFARPEDARFRLIRGLVIGGAAFGLLRWILVWTAAPPSPHNLLGADRAAEQFVHETWLRPLPGVIEARRPVVMLAANAPWLYLYWSPQPVPVEWLVPIGEGTNSPDHYRLMADHIARHRVPYILVGERELAGFITEPSPIRDVLLQDYREAGRAGRAFIFERVDR